MNIKTIPLGEIERKVKLSMLTVGNVFRFTDISFEDAVSSTNDAMFYMVVEMTPKKTGRIGCVSLDGKQLLERDDNHYVIEHKIEIIVQKAELVKST